MELIVNTLNEYLDGINKLIFPDYEQGRTRWIFRGVTNEHHKLEVSLRWVHRSLEDKSTALQTYSKEKEIEMFQRFKLAAMGIGNFTGISELDWLCLARHHTLPCRVLDWSESPLVAAYFACMEMGANGNSAVYATTMPELTNVSETQSPFETTAVKAYRPSVISPRIAAQSALVTLHPEPLAEFEPELCHKYIFPQAAQSRIKLYLNKYGIHHQSLFPDLDGIAVNLRWQYKWGIL